MRTSRSFTHTAWSIALAALVTLAATGCGGDEDEPSAPAVTAEGEDTAGSDPDGGDDAGDPQEGTGEAGASATIDGITYEATEEQTCTAFGGGMGAVFTSADGTITINIALLPDGDSEPSTVRVDDESNPDDEIQWESGSEIVLSNPDFSAVVVNEQTVEGRGGRGSATFIDTTKMMDGTATTVDGTFEVRCADL